MKERSENAYPYEFNNVYEILVCTVSAGLCERMHIFSVLLRSIGEFYCLFHMPLYNVDDLVSLFVENEGVHQTKCCQSEDEMIIKLELCILAVLKGLGHHSPFRTLKSNTNISTEEHHVFYYFFIDHMHSVRHDFIS